MTTVAEALHARNNLLYIVEHWTDLRARLRPGGGNALTGMPSGSDDPSPIDLGISDLLWQIEQEARSLGYVLLDETADWSPRTSRMPWLLEDVAQRYGHWTSSDDERVALDFCDWAEEYATKVRKALERPAPPTYVGPCQHTGEDGSGCAGELYVREGRDSVRCRECGTETTLAEQRQYLEREFQARLMTQSEIVTALVVLGTPVPIGTVKSWVQRKRLVEAVPGEGLYRLADALKLAEQRGRRVPA